MVFGFPVSLLHLALTWSWLQIFYFGVKSLLPQQQQTGAEDQALLRYLQRDSKRLGNMRSVSR